MLAYFIDPTTHTATTTTLVAVSSLVFIENRCL